jgi:hypothetical protein
LATGYYTSADGPRAVFTSSLTADDVARTDFADAPFVAQERLNALEHLRVVTVGSTGWVASLNAVERPLDWRREECAHFSWISADRPDVVANAVAVAAALGVGFSSQDWVLDEQGEVFLDLNPGGQWLFLPDEVAGAATTAIARHLIGA